MENKEIKKNAAELSDEAMEKVSGGLLKPSDIGTYVKEYIDARCPMCQTVTRIPTDKYLSMRVGGLYYCNTCRPIIIASNTETVD